MRRNKKSGILAIAVLLAALAAPAAAQLQTGNLFGVVKGPDGTLLPGVTVTLSGGGAPAVQTTDERGEVRFPGLAPGSYDLRAELDGFSPFEHEGLTINVGRNTTVEVTLTPDEGGTWLRLVVRDDGAGGAQLSTIGSSSSGLAGLTDRVHAVDGRLNLVSPPGGPTIVAIELPRHA